MDTDKTVMVSAISALKVHLEASKVPESHGLAHAQTVWQHVRRAISCSERELTARTELALQLAALTHEADDRKYFGPHNRDCPFPNAARIIEESLGQRSDAGEVQAEALWMVGQVSTSVNGNTVPEHAKARPELLWPRWADRLEAIGWPGIVRCWLYSLEVDRPLYVQDTPRPETVQQVYAAAPPSRYESYQRTGVSVSMVDHYYDKLLHLAAPLVTTPQVVSNSYITETAKDRVDPIVQICLEFGKSGTLSESLLGDARLMAGM